MDATTKEFVKQISQHQSRVYAYVLSLLGDPDQAADVLQQTNLVLWEKAGEAAKVRDFTSWAYRIAWFQVLAYRQSLRREKLIFDDDVLAFLAESTVHTEVDFDLQERALHDCLGELPASTRDLLHRRYALDVSVKRIAGDIGKSSAAIAQLLYRARLVLLQCIQRKIEEIGT